MDLLPRGTSYVLVVVLGLFGCSSGQSTGDLGADSSVADTGVAADAGLDSGSLDGAMADAGTLPDGATDDAGTLPDDAGLPGDAGTPPDDGGLDASIPDPPVLDTEIRVVTANISFGLGPAKVKQDWASYSPKADIVLLQEARDVMLRDIVDTNVWAVRQDTSSESKRGSAVVVRRSIAKPDGIGDLSLTLGVAASPCPDGGINARYMARVNVQLKSGGTLKVVSLHMPPGRCDTGVPVYANMAKNVVTLANGIQGALLLGADWNKVVSTDPNDIGKQTGLARRAPANSIDGFYFRSEALGAATAQRLAKTNSDHVPVKVVVHLK